MDPNYQGSATNTLFIGKATATVVLGNLSQVYDGTAKTATATTTPPGLMVNFTYNGSTTAPINVGSYTVVGTINDPNYQGSAAGSLVIGPPALAPVIIALDPSQVIPGGNAFLLNVYGSNFVNGSTIRWNGTGLTTTFVDSNNLMAAISKTLIAAPGMVSITVSNSASAGGGLSLPMTLNTGEPTMTPTITLARSTNIITIGWPTNGFKLQSSPVLPATNWQDVAGSEITNSVRVTIGAGNRFYRLKK